MKKINKKSVAIMAYIISIIIIIITFFIVLKFITYSNSTIASKADNLICRTYISKMSSTSGMTVLNFFTDLNYKCKVDRYNINANTKDQLFSQIAKEAKSCWYRYGNGTYHFMNHFNSVGNWCFLCGDLTFSGSVKGQSYPYSDFITWTQNNKFNESGSSMSYFNYIDFNYLGSSKSDIQNYISEYKQYSNDAFFQNNPSLSTILYSELQSALIMSSKQINTNQNLFVVYKYDRVSFSQQFNNAVNGMLIGAGTGAAIGFIGTAVVSLATAGLGVFVASDLAINTVSTFSNAEKLISLMNKVSSLMKFSTFAKAGVYVSGATSVTGGVIGNDIGSVLSTNDMQYISIMTAEEYYRSCGTNPVASSNPTVVNAKSYN